MKNLDEEVYEILQTKDKFISVSEILNELDGVSRKDIMPILQMLCRQGNASKKIIEGKVYFSTNLIEGETKNPNQKFIGDFQTALNKMSKGINDTIFQDSDIAMEKTENVNFDSIKFEYKYNKKFQNDKYEILIPDDFELEEDDGRDFIAYLKNPNGENENIITIYPSLETPYNKIPIKSPMESTYSLIYDFLFWSNGIYLFEKMGGNIKYFNEELENTTACVILNSLISGVDHYYFLCCIKGFYKQIHIEIRDINASEEERKELATKIMNKFKCKEKITEVKMLNDRYFVENMVTENLVKESVEILKMIDENLLFQFNFTINVVEAFTKYKQTVGEFSIIELKKKIREYLKRIISIFENVLKGSYEFILKARNENVANENLMELYYYINVLINNNKKLLITVEEDNVIEESTYVSGIYNKIFDNTVIELIKDYDDKNINYKTDDNAGDFYENEEKDDIQLTEKYIEEWEKEKSKIDDAKEKELEIYLFNQNKKLNEELQKLKEEKEKRHLEYNKRIIEKEKDNKEIDSEILNLNIFQFIKKEQLRNQLLINEQSIIEYKNKIKNLEREFAIQNDKAKKRNLENIDEYKETLKDKYIYPENPLTIIDEYEVALKKAKGEYFISEREQEIKNLQEIIIDVLIHEDMPLSIIEIQNSSYELQEVSIQKVSVAVKRLVDSGNLEKIVDERKAYFVINSNFGKVNTLKDKTLKDKGVNTEFSKERENIYNKLVKINKKITLKDLNIQEISKVRVLQVLKSLIKEGKVLEEIDEEIKYYAK